MNDTSTGASSPVRTIGVAIAITGGAFVGSAAVGVAFLVPLLVMGYDLGTTSVLVGTTVVGQLGLFAVGYLYARGRRIQLPLSRPSLRSLGYVVAGTVGALAVATGSFTAVSALGLEPDSALEEAAAIDPAFLLALAVLSVVLIAPVEEFLFRGVVQGRLREAFGPAGAIVGASLLFGSMHLPNYVGSPAQMLAGALVISCVGLVFGALYELTDNLVVPILVHALYNVVLMVSSYLAI